MNSALKVFVKKQLGRSIYHLGLHRKFLNGHAIIVVFHSIRDNADVSSIVNSTAKFERFCLFFKKYFEVVSMSSLVSSIQNKEDLTGKLVITFDDGYKDNYLNAVPILKKHNLPALFYIVTDFIGTDTQTWWDKKDGIRSEWASWADIRSMHQMGFEIGAHTLTHVNLGEIDPDTCYKEVTGSFDRIEQEIGIRPIFFSYPYGGKEHLSDQNRELLHRIPLKYISSAYGGFVSNTSNPLKLHRLPIGHWFQSPYQLGFELTMLSRKFEEGM